MHLQHDRRKGAQLLYAKSLDKLQHFTGIYKGLQIGRFNAQMAELFAPVVAAEPYAPIDGASFVTRAPHIEWSSTAIDEPEPAAPTAPTFLKDESRGQGPDAGVR